MKSMISVLVLSLVLVAPVTATHVNDALLEKPFCKEALAVRHYRVSERNTAKLFALVAGAGSFVGGSFVVYKAVRNYVARTVQDLELLVRTGDRIDRASERAAHFQKKQLKELPELEKAFQAERSLAADVYHARVNAAEAEISLNRMEAAAREQFKAGKLTQAELDAELRSLALGRTGLEKHVKDLVQKSEVAQREFAEVLKRVEDRKASLEYFKAYESKAKSAFDRVVSRTSKNIFPKGRVLVGGAFQLAGGALVACDFLCPSELGDGTTQGAFNRNPALFYADEKMTDAQFCGWVEHSPSLQDWAQLQKRYAQKLDAALDQVEDPSKVAEAFKKFSQAAEQDPAGMRFTPSLEQQSAPGIGSAE